MVHTVRNLFGRTFTAALLMFVPVTVSAQTLSITSGVQTFGALTNTIVTMSNRCELRLTESNSPISGCMVNLNSADSFFVLQAVKPSAVVASYLSQVRVNGAVAVADSNCRVVQYDGAGTIVIPHSSAFQPLQVFTGPYFTGTSMLLGKYVYYTGTGLGAMNANISSFKLKRGYVATFAQNQNGSGISKCYVAQDGDVEISILPANLDNNARFVYVLPWRWVGKKGSCDASPTDLKADWWYNWNLNQNSTRDLEYVAIRQQPYWPDLNQNWQTRGINHLSGYNEPNNPVEDAYQNLSPPGSVDDAVARWPDLLGTGLRVGAPAVTDGGQTWITDFMNKADAAGVRVDYVPVHYYRSYSNNDNPAGAASQLYNFLKGIYDAVKRPLWLTEFNNGANWTGDPDPTYAQNAAVIQAMIQKMDETPWVERYSIYSRVEFTRQTHYDEGGLTPMGLMYRDHVAPLAYLQGSQDNATRSFSQLAFNDNALDTSGYGNNGVTTGSPAYTNGYHGQAMVFDGLNTVVSLPPNVAKGSAFTFAAWINWGGGANWQRIFDFGNSQTHYLFLSPSSGGGTLRFAIKNGGGEQIVETSALPVNQWRHVAVTLSGNIARLYVNGVLAASNTAMSITPANFAPRVNMLGRSQFYTPPNSDPLFKGLMDEVLITDYPLTAAQIAALQTNTPPQFTNVVFSKALGNVGQLYSDTLAGNATDPDAGDTLVFSKATGPAWLTVAANGALGGTPGLTDGGTNTFVVRVSDAAGASAFATLTVFVNSQASLVARYEFEGNTLSSVGTAHGVLTGPASYAAGHLGQAIDLDGTNYVTLPAGVANWDDITVAAWVNWDGGGNWQRIFDFGNGTAQNIFLTPSSGSGTLRFVIKNGTEQLVETTPLPTGVWRHVAVTLSGNTGRIYVNGSLVANSPGMSLNPSGFNPVTNYIGKSMYAADPLFNGRIDGFHIYNYALSAAQILALSTNQPPSFASDPMTRSNAVPGNFYTATIAGSASDPESGALIYSKAGGPTWLQVSADGTLTGVPGPANVGLNSFAVRVSDLVPISDDAALNILVPPGPDALALFAFEGNTTNSTGLNHGTPSGAPGYTNGFFGQCIHLNGSNQFVTLPAGMMNVNDITIAARVNWDGGAIWQRLFDFGNNTTQYMFLTPRSGNNTLRFAITTSGNGAEQRVETTQLGSNAWVHLAVVLQGDLGKLYVDGALVATNAITLNPSTFNPTLNYIGKSLFASDALFDGRVDDFSIFNRALSDFEIANLANPALDSDSDGLSDTAEGTADSDGDGTADFLDTDSDNDGIPDSVEGFVDTDGDNIANLRDIDSDGDTMPDSWEFTYGLNPTNAADLNLDLDGDGQSNREEYIAGTQPNNPNDYFAQAVSSVAPFSVSVPGVTGRTYTLWRSASLTTPVAWVGIVTNGPLVSSELVTLTDPASPNSTSFYRTSVSFP